MSDCGNNVMCFQSRCQTLQGQTLQSTSRYWRVDLHEVWSAPCRQREIHHERVHTVPQGNLASSTQDAHAQRKRMGTCVRELECSLCTQATSKGLCSNLRARPVWSGPSKFLSLPLCFFAFLSLICHWPEVHVFSDFRSGRQRDHWFGFAQFIQS